MNANQPTSAAPGSVLITGATGFVGSAIARQCQEAGFSLTTTGRTALASASLPNYLKADLLNPVTIPALLRDAESVVHSAGLAHQFDMRKNDSAQCLNVNVEGTANVVQAAANVGVRHFVLISSVAVYGSQTTGECNELSSCNPDGPYAQSKYLAEQRAIEIAQERGMALTILRMATVYGEGDPGNVARLMRAIDRGFFIWIGSGGNRKSIIHREDLARACVRVLSTETKGINIYNVADRAYMMREIVTGLASALGRPVPRLKLPAPLMLGLASAVATLVSSQKWPNAIQKLVADNIYDCDRFRRMFAFKPQVSLSEGLSREVDWYRRQINESC